MAATLALIDERRVIERILRHLGLREQGLRVRLARVPPESVPTETIIEPWFDLSAYGHAQTSDPFPDYEHEPVMMYANK